MSEEEPRLLEIGAHTFKLTKTVKDGLIFFKSEALPQPTDAPIPVYGQGRTLAIFESESRPGEKHYVNLAPDGTIYCTCWGFRSPDHCWHYRGMIKMLEDIPLAKITEPITVGFTKKE